MASGLEVGEERIALRFGGFRLLARGLLVFFAALVPLLAWLRLWELNLGGQFTGLAYGCLPFALAAIAASAVLVVWLREPRRAGLVLDDHGLRELDGRETRTSIAWARLRYRLLGGVLELSDDEGRRIVLSWGWLLPRWMYRRRVQPGGTLERLLDAALQRGAREADGGPGLLTVRLRWVWFVLGALLLAWCLYWTGQVLADPGVPVRDYPALSAQGAAYIRAALPREHVSPLLSLDRFMLGVLPLLLVPLGLAILELSAQTVRSRGLSRAERIRFTGCQGSLVTARAPGGKQLRFDVGPLRNPAADLASHRGDAWVVLPRQEGAGPYRQLAEGVVQPLAVETRGQRSARLRLRTALVVEICFLALLLLTAAAPYWVF
jgi:hypothetical protein